LSTLPSHLANRFLDESATEEKEISIVSEKSTIADPVVASSENTYGIAGETIEPSKNTYGVVGETVVPSRNTYGIAGAVAESSKNTYGIAGETAEPAKNTYGIAGESVAPSKNTYGTAGETEPSKNIYGIVDETAEPAKNTYGGENALATLPQHPVPSTQLVSSDGDPESADSEESASQEEPETLDKGNSLYNSFIGLNKIPTGKVTIGKYLAAGAFGKVYRGEWGSKLVALKQINVDHARAQLRISEEAVKEAMRWEVSRLSTADHPNLVQFYGLYQDKPEGYPYLVMEFCEGGTLQEAIAEEVSWSKRWQWALQITEALAYLHSEGVLHRALKAENILLDRYGRAKLADLGVAQVDALLQEQEAKVVGAGLQDKRFIAPESARNKTISSKATDIYALGLVFWQLASAQEPRYPNELSDYYGWMNGDHTDREDVPEDCPESFKQLILSCWKYEPESRPKAEELISSLKGLGSEYDVDHHSLVKASQKLEKLIHPKRKEGLSYIAPFVTRYAVVDESIESYWTRVEAAVVKGEEAGNPPLTLAANYEQFIKAPGAGTLLLLGEAGLGKTLTTYLWADQLLGQWWNHMNNGAPSPLYFPIFIRPSTNNWTHEGTKGAFLKIIGEYSIPGSIAPLVFVDGYDELGGGALSNLVSHLGLSAYPHAKVIVTCRPHIIERNKQDDIFSFNGKLETRYFLSFSVEQLLTYLQKELSWSPETYNAYKKTLAEAEAVRTVLRNPFVLYLLGKSWETVSKKPLNRLNRFQIYEGFIEHIIGTQKLLLSKNLRKLLKGNCPSLLVSYQAFVSEVAMKAFNHKAITLSLQEAKGLSEWVNLGKYAEEEAKKEFVGRQEQLQIKLANADDSEKEQLLRRSLLKEEDYVLMKLKDVQQVEAELPMKVRGSEIAKSYEYSHKSLFEYFMAKRLLLLKDSNQMVEEGVRLLEKRPIQEEKESLIFFEEGWGEEEVNRLKEPLFEIIKASKHNATKTQASANAATLLSAAHVPFSGQDLSGVRIKGANLSNAVLNYTCLYKADLQDVVFHSVWLENADLREANLQGTYFGEFPSLQFRNGVNSVAYSKDGMQMAIGLDNGSIAFYKKENQTYKPITTLKEHSRNVSSVMYSPDGKQLASGSMDNTVVIWDTGTLQAMTQLKGHTHFVNSVTYSPDGKQLASGSYNNTMVIWDMQTLQAVTQLKGHSSSVLSVAYSPDCKQLASGSGDWQKGELWIWDMQTLQAVAQLKGHSAGVSSVTYSPDGKQLASRSKDYTVWIWDTHTLQAVTQLKGHLAGVNSVTYSLDSKQLASASSDNAVFLWAKQHSACLSGDQENWQLIYRFETSHRLSAQGGFLKRTNISVNNRELLKQRGAGDDQNPCNSEQWSPGAKHLMGHIVAVMVPLSQMGRMKEYREYTALLNSRDIILRIFSYLWEEANFHDINFSSLPQLLQGFTEKMVLTSTQQQSIVEVTSYELLLKQKLIAAASKGYKEGVALLLHEEAIMEAADEESCTSLIHAVKNNHKEVVELLLSKGANMEAADKESCTPLIWAAYNGHKEIVELLLSKRANMEASDKEGKTALLCAAENDCKEVVELLLSKGANIEIVDKAGKTALIYAAGNGRKEVVELLLGKGANIEAKDRESCTPLIHVIYAAKNNRKGIAELLLSKGANMEAADKESCTPLICAAKNNRKGIAELLLSKGANMEAADKESYTPLIRAAQWGHKEIVELLLSKGASIEAADKNGCTSLIWVLYGLPIMVAKK
jgi:ankyrin repeat protein/serine/threonine protein kinase